VRAIDVALDKATEKDGYGRLLVGDSWSPSVRVTRKASRRALLRLDSLLKGLAERGHQVDRGDPYRPNVREPAIWVHGEKLTLRIEEKLDSTPHVLTAEERRNQDEPLWYHSRIPKHDHFPCGRLSFRLDNIKYTYKGTKVWSDSKVRSLDGRLGIVILGMETAAQAVKEHRIEQERLEREREAEQRRRARKHNLSVYSKWLADDLERMVNDRIRANRIREFLQAFKAKLPSEARDTKTAEWISAVAEFADCLDPLSKPERMARPIEMSDDELAEFVERLEKHP